MWGGKISLMTSSWIAFKHLASLWDGFKILKLCVCSLLNSPLVFSKLSKSIYYGMWLDTNYNTVIVIHWIGDKLCANSCMPCGFHSSILFQWSPTQGSVSSIQGSQKLTEFQPWYELVLGYQTVWSSWASPTRKSKIILQQGEHRHNTG